MTAAHLAFAGDGFVEQQAVAIMLIYVVVWLAAEAGHAKGFEAVSGQGRRWSGRVGLVTWRTPAPVSAAAVAGWSETSVLPGTV